MPDNCMQRSQYQNEALPGLAGQKRRIIFERYARRDFSRESWGIEEMLAETIQDVYGEALLVHEMQEFPSGIDKSPLPPTSLRSGDSWFLRSCHKDIYGRYTYEGYLERLDIAKQLGKPAVLAELISALEAAASLIPETIPVRADVVSLCDDLRLYAEMPSLPPGQSMAYAEMAKSAKMLEIIAELFEAPCTWGDIAEFMESGAAGWCENNCGKAGDAACWEKFLELKIEQQQQIGNYT